MSDDLLSVRDDLEADMSAHQRNRSHVEVTAESNQALAADVLRRLERERAEAKPTKPEFHGSAPVEPRTEVREIDDKKYIVDIGMDAGAKFRPATKFEKLVMAHANARLELLLSKHDEGPLGTPSWYAKTLAAMYFKVKSLEAQKAGRTDLETEYDRRFMQDLYDLLESSNPSFGDWRKSADEKIQFAVT